MNKISRCQPLLGTFVELTINADCDLEQLIAVTNQAFTTVNRVHRALSFHDPNSELSHINQYAHQHPVQLSDMASEVLAFALKLNRQTRGAYDISVAPWLIKDGYLPNPVELQSNHYNDELKVDLTAMQLESNQVFFKQPLLLDLGGIAKGYAVDQAMQVMVEQLGDGLEQATVNAGGDLKVCNWRDFTTLIPGKDKTMHSGVMKNAALATSSDYYLAGNSGIYAPTTGDQIDIPATISVFAEQCMVADALTKVAAVLGANDSIFSSYNAEVILT